MVYLALALAVCSSGSLAALDASPAETASSNNLVQDKHDFQVRTSTLYAKFKVNNLSVLKLGGVLKISDNLWLFSRPGFVKAYST